MTRAVMRAAPFIYALVIGLGWQYLHTLVAVAALVVCAFIAYEDAR